MLDEAFHGELPGVKSVRLRIVIERDVHRALRALWKNPSEKRDTLPFGNFQALAFLLEPLDSAESTFCLSPEGRQLFSQESLTEDTYQSVNTPHGPIEIYIEKLDLTTTRNVPKNGMVYNAAKTQFVISLQKSCKSQPESRGCFIGETIVSQTLSAGEYMEEEMEDEVGALCSALAGSFLPFLNAPHRPLRFQRPLEVFAFSGGSGTGKTVGMYRISRMVSSLWPTHDTIPFIIHISIDDIIPTSESADILGHLEALNANLSRVFRTARLTRPFVLVLDDMHLLFSQRSVGSGHDDAEEIGPYHPLLTNFLMHAVNAFIDEESLLNADASGHIVCVFQERAEIPSALKGPNRIFRIFDADLPNMRPDDRITLKAFRKAVCIDGNPDETPCDERTAELHTVRFLRHNLQRLYNQRCFCCVCVGLKVNRTACCSECSWLGVLGEYTKGWTKAELMALISKSASAHRWNIRAAMDYAISYTPLAIRRVVACTDTVRDATSSASPLVDDFIHFGGAWRKIQLLLLGPLRSSLSAPRREDAVVNVPKGMLIHGKCGTGKTTLLSQIQATLQAHREQVDFSACPSDISGGPTNFPGLRVLRFDATRVVSKYFGESEGNLAALFRQARKLRPCVILADHIEQIIGVSRDISETSNYDERLLSTFLTEMSGLHSEEETERPLVFIGVTHYDLRSLDAAALRAGRLELHISLDETIDAHDASQALECFTQRIPSRISEDTFRAAGECLARASGGDLVIAEIKQCSNEIAWRALSRGSDFVEDEDVRATMKGWKA
ncbi:cell division control protein [Perkinsela sp. CCAP 1560/4]|nr:cell division control protein [Perkinsela sp. CCAP 1560/4]KNH09166.1 cell division control protein [Perkinsela sp. CCAP 1560/4]|eukprot:KNH04372.1 cell division control protein [Perkinsela sp. CCAP 1560/4]